jgi:hypothetical protein
LAECWLATLGVATLGVMGVIIGAPPFVLFYQIPVIEEIVHFVIHISEIYFFISEFDIHPIAFAMSDFQNRFFVNFLFNFVKWQNQKIVLLLAEKKKVERKRCMPTFRRFGTCEPKVPVPFWRNVGWQLWGLFRRFGTCEPKVPVPFWRNVGWQLWGLQLWGLWGL